MYQFSPTASKGNAFCWLSYQAQISWKASQQDTGQAKRNVILDEKRAAGVDPAYIPRLGSSARHEPPNPARFTIASGRRS